MSIHALPAPVVTPAIEAARAAVSSATSVPVTALPVAELADGIATLAALESQAAALRLELAAEAERRRVAAAEAATGTDAWVSRLTGDPRHVARGGLLVQRLLSEKYAATRAAFAAGDLRFEQVRTIVLAAERIPERATPSQVAAAEQWLVGRATGAGNRDGRPLSDRRLRAAARRMCSLVDPELAKDHEHAMLTRERRTAESETWLTLNDDGNGRYSGRFVIPELHGALLKASLDRLTSPRRLGRDRAGDRVVDDTLPGAGEVLSWSERLGAAFTELIEHLPTDGHKGNAVTMLVRADLQDLVTGLGTAALDTGIEIDAGAARRLACEAEIVPAVMGGPSVPLDLGRSRRLHDRNQRLALGLRHDSCAVAGCERPYAWCEIHHPRAWSRGGRTDLGNAVPLCGWHHQRAHDDVFDLRRTACGDWRFHRRR
ncbi:HNH endonuclease signature motif containing protein [Nocardioides donggukensis]|uniref:DUF222 domain-containing protein n=1 Tax=Nocardioides donggukensis TaxID=2774019 RepID=A0A927Q1Y8_9ACTN|nr:HNH endonuclease signature motif containing protein [Nocardioides donggukensis]MBD8869176.1 DUF222 domain-containing protein [Nocardioides donggukensis]